MTHADSFLEHKLFTLPKSQQEIISVHKNPVEKAVYWTVFHRFVERMRLLWDMTEEEGKEKKELSAAQFTCALRLLLCLRQITAHPLLVQDCMQDLLEHDDYAALRAKLASMAPEPGNSQDTREHLQAMLQQAGNLPMLDYEDDTSNAAASTPALENSSTTTDHFNTVFHVAEQRGKVQNLARKGCPTCKKLQINPMLTACGHTYCNTYLFEMYAVAKADGTLQPTCITCGASIALNELKPYSEDYAPLVGAEEPTKDDRKAFKKSRASIIRDTIAGWVNESREVLQSSKTLAVGGKILDILTKTPDAKIICYTQFKPV